MVMRSKVDRVGPVFTDTHAHEEKSKGFETVLAFKMKTEAARNFGHSANRSAIKSKKELADRTKARQMKRSRRARNEVFNATTAEEWHVGVSYTKLSGERNGRHDGLKHVAREPAIGTDFQGIEFPKNSSTMTSGNKLST
jgi:hypothetical protein